jgi:hypothetical protein
MSGAAALACLAALIATSGGAATPRSFREVRERIFAHPLAQPAPPPFGPLPELSLLAGALSGRLSGRLNATLASTDDFKEPEEKPIHRQGVCADGVWDIAVSTEATGLFEYGTHANAIIRFASGTNRAVYSRILPRNFGIALKLFPGAETQVPVVSANAFVFDQNGLAGEVRPGFLVKNADAPDIMFSNITDGTRLMNRLGKLALERFDKPALARPLYQLAEVSNAGQSVAEPRTPARMVLAAQPSAHARLPVPADYREELAAYPPGTLRFDVFIAMEEDTEPTWVGVLTILNTVFSRECDADLHFAHVPWRKAPASPAN